jgi:2-dehydro-3-deoxyphosphogluconate aldolase/(4S)-4-hydroxy-2-oxoglutarate aldolase
MNALSADWLAQAYEAGAIAILRRVQADKIAAVASAIRDGGIRCLEITLDSPTAIEDIGRLSRDVEGIVVGAGTVLDAPSARQAILAGARFIVTPTIEPGAGRMARRYGAGVIMGAMTPTEALRAWEAACDLVKVFPANTLGPQFVRALRGPLPQIPLAPTGGITADNAGEFIRAGAHIVCVGGWLTDPKAIMEGRLEIIRERAQAITDATRKAREEAN